ncbi:hypothetical protein B0T25DRAFT_529720 [Lasiosphaeria hispida]|uniref:Uncharacterized protein n=1 Tax=Lasiosphaeria hispida TaxID=260671 RepID=A0AAJ0HX49_9PEZI|nr:hypothetical protein B0T25DRAFT_529720 [Lasiosphaeria hispida]
MDFAHDLGLSDEQLNMATAIAAPFFADPIADSLRNPKVPGMMEFCRIVRETALSKLWNDMRKFKQHPASMPDFLSLANSIFSKQHLENLASQANHFDVISGFSAVSDCFISSRPAIDAIKDIIWGIVSHSATESQEAILNPPPTSATEVTQGQHPPPETTQPHQQSSSGQSVLGPSRNLLPIGPGAVDTPCRIQQISLEGPTIAEAWLANATTNAMENLALSVGPDADPSSMAFRALPVYHGTDWEIEDNEDTIDDPQRGRLARFVSRNQVAPNRGGVLSVVWTGFSPLRCFLWAAFKAEVLHQVPTETVKDKLECSWNCAPSMSGSSSPHTHSGVTLFKFRPSLPSAFDQTHYVMPKGREAEWERICSNHSVRIWTPSAEVASHVTHLWDQFSTIHGGALDTWPNTLHCHEYGPQLNMLRCYTRQLWRTVWFGAGVEALNNSHEVTYAISFKLAAPVPPEISSGKEEKSRFK